MVISYTVSKFSDLCRQSWGVGLFSTLIPSHLARDIWSKRELRSGLMAKRVTTNVLFVCMGNICRSPMAEGAFLFQLGELGLKPKFRVDSAGVGSWHSGEAPDERAVAIAKKRGVKLMNVARAVVPKQDFENFDWLIAMDQENISGLLALGANPDKIRLLRSYDPSLKGKSPDELEVPDPYYGGVKDFAEVYDMMATACAGMLEAMTKKK